MFDVNDRSTLDLHGHYIGMLKAPIDFCWDKFAEIDSDKEWVGPQELKLEVIKDGYHGRIGYGTWRRGTTDDPNHEIFQEINHFWPPYMFAYRTVGGTPALADHQAVILFREKDGGTEMAYHVSGRAFNSADAPALQKKLEAALAALSQSFIVYCDAEYAKETQ